MHVTVKQCQANSTLRFYRGIGVFLVGVPRRSREDSFAVPVAGGFQAVMRHPGGNRGKSDLPTPKENLNVFEFCDLTLRNPGLAAMKYIKCT